MKAFHLKGFFIFMTFCKLHELICITNKHVLKEYCLK